MKRNLTTTIAAFGLCASAILTGVPAQAQSGDRGGHARGEYGRGSDRGGYGGYRGGDGGYYDDSGDGLGLALGAGVLGFVLGSSIAADQSYPNSYYQPGYYGPGYQSDPYGYSDDYSDDYSGYGY